MGALPRRDRHCSWKTSCAVLRVRSAGVCTMNDTLSSLPKNFEPASSHWRVPVSSRSRLTSASSDVGTRRPAAWAWRTKSSWRRGRRSNRAFRRLDTSFFKAGSDDAICWNQPETKQNKNFEFFFSFSSYLT